MIEKALRRVVPLDDHDLQGTDRLRRRLEV